MATIRSGFSPSGMKMQPRAPAIRSGFAPARGVAPRSDPFAGPISLYGEIDVPSGSEAEVSSGSISNNTGRTIDVREIRFVASIADHGTNQFLNPAGVLRAMVTVNGKPLMAIPTPIWMLCRLDRATNQIVEEGRLAATYVMRLSRVMQLPPGAEVRCKFEHNGVVPFVVTGAICLAGKFTDQRSTTTAIPYALFWASQFRGYLDVTSEASTEKNLSNTFKRSLQIDRIICRHVTLGSGSFAVPTDPAIYLSEGHDINFSAFGSVAPITDMASLKLVTSRNQPIIADASPIWSVFETSGAIEMPHSIPSGDFYRATVTTAAAPVGLQATLASLLTFRHQVQLSMVGWREETI